MFKGLQKKLVIEPLYFLSVIKGWVLKLLSIQAVTDSTGKINYYKCGLGIKTDTSHYGKNADGVDLIGINEMEKFTVNIPHKIDLPLGSIVTIVNPKGRLWGQNGFLGNLIVDADDVVLAEKK